MNQHALRCDWCGKFRTSRDLRAYELPNYNRTDVEIYVVCRWCSPDDFKKEER